MTKEPPKTTLDQAQAGTSRRAVIKGVAGMAGAAAIGSTLAPSAEARAKHRRPPIGTGGLPDPADSGIDHIVVVMMENRSFDHMLG